MIVLDEQLRGRSLITALEKWYSGTVVDILTLRPNSVIKDDNIATLLHSAQRPLFVTINVKDFWPKIQPNLAYCVIVIDLSQENAHELSGILRQLLNRPEFKTRALRMGKVILVRESGIKYYGQNGQILELE